MKYPFSFLWLFLSPLALAANPSTTDTGIILIGPTGPIEPGEYVQIFVEGVAEDQVQTTLVKYWPRTRTVIIPARLWTGETFILFTSKSPGEYIIQVIGAKNNTVRYAECIVTVGGEDPEPPNSPWQVVIVYQSDKMEELPYEQLLMLTSLSFRQRLLDAGHLLVKGGIVDRDIKDARGDIPTVLAPYLNVCSDDESFPRVCIAPISGGKVLDFPLPQTEKELMTLLQTTEGRE